MGGIGIAVAGAPVAGDATGEVAGNAAGAAVPARAVPLGGVPEGGTVRWTSAGDPPTEVAAWITAGGMGLAESIAPAGGRPTAGEPAAPGEPTAAGEPAAPGDPTTAGPAGALPGAAGVETGVVTAAPDGAMVVTGAAGVGWASAAQPLRTKPSAGPNTIVKTKRCIRVGDPGANVSQARPCRSRCANSRPALAEPPLAEPLLAESRRVLYTGRGLCAFPDWHAPPVTMRKIDVTLSKIRLLLSEVAQRESFEQALRDQYLAQRNRILQASLYGDVDLTTVLGFLDDIDRKLGDLERGARQLALLRQRAEQELRSLTLTRQVEDAKADLAAIQRREDEITAELGGLDHEDGPSTAPRLEALQDEQARLAEEAGRLRALIAEASDLAARSFSQAVPLTPPPPLSSGEPPR